MGTEEQKISRNRGTGTVGTLEHWAQRKNGHRRTVGTESTEEPRNSRHRETVGTEEQSGSRHRVNVISIGMRLNSSNLKGFHCGLLSGIF